MTGVTQAVFMNQRSFGSGWIATLGYPGFTNYGQAIALDSSKNVYLAGEYDGSQGGILYAKYNAKGAIQFQSRLGDLFTNSSGDQIAVDSSSNVYLIGTQVISGIPTLVLLKKDPYGGGWQRSLGSSQQGFGYGIAVDSSGNVFVVGVIETNSGPSFVIRDMQIAKYNASGTLQWQRSLSGGPSVDVTGAGIALDSSSNVYVVGSSNATGTYQMQLAKYNTSGVIQWQRCLGDSVAPINSVAGSGIAVDASSNVYVIGSAYSPVQIQFAKYDTNGSIQWQRSLGDISVATNASGITVDSSGNVYLVGTYSNGQGILIAKYSISGNIQWQRRLDANPGFVYGYSIAVDAVSNVYVVGKTDAGAPQQVLMASLPDDGTKTGTYSVGGYSYIYAATSLTDSSTSLTDAASSLTDAASSLTSNTSFLANNPTSLTSNTTQI